MSDKTLSSWGTLSTPTLLGLLQLLPLLSSPSQRKGLIQAVNVRSLAAVAFGGLAWKIMAHLQVKKLLWQLVEGHAIVRHGDEAYTWLHYFLKTHPRFGSSARDIEVSAPAKTSRKSIMRSYKGEDENDEEDSDKYFVPGPTFTMFFAFQGILFRARTQEIALPDGGIDKKIDLTYWSLSKLPLHRLVIHSKQLYRTNHQEESSVSVHRISEHGSWRISRYTNIRKLETLHLQGSLKEDISVDAKKFFSEEGLQQYTKRSVPYRRGYCFHGPPGNGKSTLVQVLASELGEDLYVIDLNKKDFDDSDFLYAMSRLPPRCILLIEDVDAIFVDREQEDDGKSTVKSGVSFSALLNALDGPDAPDSRLLCITTNHYERLDDALLRPGRIDRSFEIRNATKEQCRELFIRWFKPIDESAVQEIKEQAEVFASSIPDDKYSIASLQNYLLRFDDDSRKAAQGVQVWMQELAKNRRVRSTSRIGLTGEDEATDAKLVVQKKGAGRRGWFGVFSVVSSAL